MENLILWGRKKESTRLVFSAVSQKRKQKKFLLDSNKFWNRPVKNISRWDSKESCASTRNNTNGTKLFITSCCLQRRITKSTIITSSMEDLKFNLPAGIWKSRETSATKLMNPGSISLCSSCWKKIKKARSMWLTIMQSISVLNILKSLRRSTLIIINQLATFTKDNLMKILQNLMNFSLIRSINLTLEVKSSCSSLFQKTSVSIRESWLWNLRDIPKKSKNKKKARRKTS